MPSGHAISESGGDQWVAPLSRVRHFLSPSAPQQPTASSNPGHAARAEASSQLELCEGVLLLTLKEKILSEDVACSNHGGVCGGACAGPRGQGDEAPMLTLVSENEAATFWQVPMEDEYTDRPPPSPDSMSSPLPTQPGSKCTPPFSEPLEVGENDSLSQCFTGTENLVDSDSCVFSGPLCKTDWGCQGCETDVQKAGEAAPCPHWVDSCVGCRHLLGEDSQLLLGSPKASPLPQCAYGMGLPPTEAVADRAEPGGHAVDGADSRLPSSERAEGPSADQPPVSGKCPFGQLLRQQDGSGLGQRVESGITDRSGSGVLMPLSEWFVCLFCFGGDTQ